MVLDVFGGRHGSEIAVCVNLEKAQGATGTLSAASPNEYGAVVGRCHAMGETTDSLEACQQLRWCS